MFGGPIEHRPHLCTLLDDARITGLCAGILGEDFNYASGDGNVGVHSPGGYKVDTGAGMYFPTILDTAGPERMRLLRQCAAIHDELFPQYARK